MSSEATCGSILFHERFIVFQSLLSFLWIGAQFPQVKFLSYGRILTLHYYFLLMCILFSCNLNFIWKFVGLLMTDDRNEKRNAGL